jgi:heme exporter protein C
MVAQPERWYDLPIIPGLEEKARIVFFHVPSAWISTVAFVTSMVFGIRYLRGRRHDDDIKSAAAAGIGLLFCILATVTGAVWARFSWGTFWNWDPRQTSIFILLMVYGAYFALRSAIDVEEKRAALSAVYTIIAAAVMPFFMFVVPRILESLHPQPVLNTAGKTEMNSTMLILLLTSFVGFTGLSLWIWNLQVRIYRLEVEREPSYSGDRHGG